MAPRKPNTAPLFNNDRVNRVVGTVDNLSTKSVGWWLVVMGLTLVLLLGGSTYYLNGELKEIRQWQLSYVMNDQKALIKAVESSTAAIERTNGILTKIEQKQPAQ